jgi:hypothetical protein
MLRVQRLQDHGARLVAAPGAPGHLLDHLAHAFQRPVIGTVERLVDVDDHDQRHAGKMVSLGQHLCAYQQAGLALAHFLDLPVQHTLAGRLVTVEAHARKRRSRASSCWAFAGARQRIGGSPAQRRRAALAAAVMADQPPGATVPGQVRVAALAQPVPATGLAHQHRCVTATVEEHHGLFAPRQAPGDRLQHCFRQPVENAVLAHVEHPPGRQRRPGGALAQPVPAVASLVCIPERLQ